ncbi:MAG: hypothetical protein V9G13_08075 [Marmoricola sp.]
MHDDVFLVMNDGWLNAAKPRKTIEDKDRKLSETPDLVVGSGRSATKYKMDLIPPSLIVARYFAAEQATIDDLTAAAEEATRAVEEYVEEHAVEDGLLADAMDDDKISKALIAARLKAIKTGGDPDEIKALQYATKLYNAEAAAKKAVKDAQADLDLATLKKIRRPDRGRRKVARARRQVAGDCRAPRRRRSPSAHARPGCTDSAARRTLRRDGERPRCRTGESSD